MSEREVIHSDNAPQAIGPYSQAIKVDDTVYLSGQIPLDPATMEMEEGAFADQAELVFLNLKAVAAAAGGSLDDIVKLNVFLTDLSNFGEINRIMEKHFSRPFPARAAVQVAALPRGAAVEMDAVMVIGG
jgi:reactive intermediate/imine deaminase